MDRSQPSRDISKPEPCFLRIRLVRHGRFVGGRIFRRLGMLCAELNGKPADVDAVWTSGEFIDEATYEILMTDPPRNPYLPVFVSEAGLADRVREQEEQDWWMTRPLS